MVDNVNPTTQFHPYQPVTAEPHADSGKASAVNEVLSRFGVDSSRAEAITRRMEDMNLRGQLESARSWGRSHGGLLLGGLAAAVIGAGLLSRRSNVK